MRVVLRVVAAVLLVLGLICGGTWLYARSDHGRRVIAQHIAHTVNEHIPGSMTIGRIERLSLRHAVVSDVRFMHPDGSLILRAKHATIDFDPRAALHRELVFTGARVDGGFLLVGAGASGRTGLEETFSRGHTDKSKTPESPQDRGGHYLHMRLRDLRVHDMTVAIRPSPKHPLRLEHVSARIDIEHRDTPGVRVRLKHVAGSMSQPKFLGDQLDIVSADGWVHGATPHVINLDVSARFGKGELDGRFDYFHRHEKPVEIALAPKSGAAPYAAALAATMGSWFTHTIHVGIEKS